MSPLRRFLIDSKSQWGWLALLILALISSSITWQGRRCYYQWITNKPRH